MLMLLRFKTLLKGVILPPAGPLLLAILGVVLIKRRPLLARACLILGLGSLWLLSTPVVSDALTGLAEHYPPLDLRSTSGAQAIVILGEAGSAPSRRNTPGRRPNLCCWRDWPMAPTSPAKRVWLFW